ncbi:hypothetical protein CSUB01_10896 [Colletotrichum sublineola]|uniref:WD domain-containing protein n=1 Tax=Colletotrichum sublineola TaxID=1173701 RepID=A0A066X5U5_COLSU|nr:hypothetical protein CSUB01_10896 [Colletotrichum sublineola]
MAISKDGSTYAYARKNMVHSWSMDNFTADGQWLASTSRSGTIKIWDTLTEDLEQNITDLDDFRRAMVSFDGQWIASGGFSVRLWEAKTGRLIKELEGDFENEPGHVQSLAFSDDGKLLAASFHYSIYKFPAAKVSIVALSKDHEHLVAASSTGEITTWQTKTGAQIHTLQADTGDAAGDNNLKVDDEYYDLYRGVYVTKDPAVTSLAFRDRFHLALSSWGIIKIVNLSDGTTAQAHSEHPSRYVELMASSTDGRLLAYSFRRRSRYTVYDLKIWDTATEQCSSLPVENFFVTIFEYLLTELLHGQPAAYIDFKRQHILLECEILPFDTNDRDWLVLDGRRLLWIPPGLQSKDWERYGAGYQSIDPHMDKQDRKIGTDALSAATLVLGGILAAQHTDKMEN